MPKFPFFFKSVDDYLTQGNDYTTEEEDSLIIQNENSVPKEKKMGSINTAAQDIRIKGGKTSSSSSSSATKNSQDAYYEEEDDDDSDDHSQEEDEDESDDGMVIDNSSENTHNSETDDPFHSVVSFGSRASTFTTKYATNGSDDSFSNSSSSSSSSSSNNSSTSTSTSTTPVWSSASTPVPAGARNEWDTDTDTERTKFIQSYGLLTNTRHFEHGDLREGLLSSRRTAGASMLSSTSPSSSMGLGKNKKGKGSKASEATFLGLLINYEMEADAEKWLVIITLCYTAITQVIGFCLLLFFSEVEPELKNAIKDHGSNRVFWVFFMTVTSFTNLGFNFWPDGLDNHGLSKCPGLVLTMSILIVSGNTCIPIFVRFWVWMCRNLSSQRNQPKYMQSLRCKYINKKNSQIVCSCVHL